MPDFSSPSQFEAEARHLFRRSPLPLARRSELGVPGAFVTREVALIPLLLTRGDAEDDVRVMVNLCRHRGTKLVYEPCGVAETFTCRFHGWTYDRGGVLGLPDGKRTLFVPASPREESSLVLVEHAERHGFVWAVATARVPFNLAAHLGEADAVLERLALAARTAHDRDPLRVFRNYKQVVANLLGAPGAILAFPNLVLFPVGADVVTLAVWPRLPAETNVTVTILTHGAEATEDSRFLAAHLERIAGGEDGFDGPPARAYFAEVSARLASLVRT